MPCIAVCLHFVFPGGPEQLELHDSQPCNRCNSPRPVNYFAFFFPLLRRFPFSFLFLPPLAATFSPPSSVLLSVLLSLSAALSRQASSRPSRRAHYSTLSCSRIAPSPASILKDIILTTLLHLAGMYRRANRYSSSPRIDIVLTTGLCACVYIECAGGPDQPGRAGCSVVVLGLITRVQPLLPAPL